MKMCGLGDRQNPSKLVKNINEVYTIVGTRDD